LKKIFRNILLLFVLGWLLLAFQGCRQASDVRTYRIGFSQCCDDPWRDVMNGEMQRELLLHPELDFKIKVAESNNELQEQQIKQLVEEGIDILLVSPNEARPLTAAIEEVYKAGIPVVLIDRKTDSELYTAYIGADNYEIGKTAGRYVANRMNGQAKVIEILLPLTISPGAARNRGFQDGIVPTPGVEVVAALETKGGLEDINEFLPEILRQHPEATVIFGHTDLLAEMAYKIAQDMGRAKDMLFVGIDGIPGTGRGIQAVEDGILDASILYPTGGAEAIRLSLSVLINLPYKKENTLETIVIDHTNAQILHNQMKKVFSLQESIDVQVNALKALKNIYADQRVYIFVLLSSLLLALVLGVFLWKSLRSKQAAYQSLEKKNQEILEHERQLVEMSEEVRQAIQAKVDFFTNISHEFRTPLTLILGFAEELLPSKILGNDEQQSIGHIRQNAFRLLRLINQLMDFRKVESQQLKLRASENDLVAFVRNIMESYSKTAQNRGIDFQLLSRQEQLLIWFDAGMMDKVLFNLLSNTFKFTPDGGKIHLSISVDNFENKVKLTVEDNGKGMTPAEVKHVFEPFFQGEDQQLTGTGLGLSLSKSLVELHSGDITAQSSKGKGSRFTVSLPLGRQHLREDQIVEAQVQYLANEEFFLASGFELEAPEAEAESIAATQQILVIEDNEDLQYFLRKKLSGTFQVVQASEGNEGLTKAFELTPDLIMCDIMLPGMNGLEITRTLKSDLRTSHIPIILLSARSTVEQQIEGTETGADSYITKPFNVQFLLAKIKSLLLNRQVLQESYSNRLLVHAPEALMMQLPKTTAPLDRDFIQKFVMYIEKHYTRQDFQVADLCQEFGLSRSQLYRKVNALLGESISDYIQNIRLKKSENLLLMGKLSVAEIAYQVGYSAPDYFSTVFRSRYGVSPTAFRKKE
jgi:signal transduction histidine kinase/DNA-binding response OmpR family regulator